MWIMVGPALLMGYLLGSVNPSILLAKMAGMDIRREGSGNAGTTNTLRVLGKKAALATLIVDVLKGTAAVLLGMVFADVSGWPWPFILLGMAAGLGAMLGHNWPAFFGFRGGKGVATTFGVLMGVHFYLALACFGVMVMLVLVTKRVSVGSLGVAVTLPVLIPFVGGDAYEQVPEWVFMWGLLISIMLIVKHRGNIKRLLKREEPKLNLKRKGA
jgi:glycerol-3-phosphate acyltransferase PlsY